MSGVYWQREPGRRRPRLDGDATTDVLIVGAGIGGLAAAWQLRQRDVTSMIVDARDVAMGASGRNGGFLIAGAAPMYNDARELFGADLARRFYAATLAAQDEVIGTAAEVGASDAVRRVGLLRLAVDADEAEHVRAHHAALVEDAFPGELVAEEALPEPLRRPGRAGLWTSHDASVHPVRLLRALADALAERGMRIHPDTPVVTLTSRTGSVLATTPRGTIDAGHVIVASDAGVGALVPPFADHIRPRRLHMIATAALGVAHVAHPVYARYGYEYHQQLPDGRVVLGGFSDLDGPASYTDREEASAAVHARLRDYLRVDLGIAAPVEREWVGVVGYTADHRPVVGPAPALPGVWVMGGYCGTGNLCSWVAGRVLADLITTGRSHDSDLFSHEPAPRAPT
jgi:glycine/D-amino acid oxidase-like deaminating enzyme